MLQPFTVCLVLTFCTLYIPLCLLASLLAYHLQSTLNVLPEAMSLLLVVPPPPPLDAVVSPDSPPIAILAALGAAAAAAFASSSGGAAADAPSKSAADEPEPEPIDISIPYDAAAVLTYCKLKGIKEVTDQTDFEAFKTVYEEAAVAEVTLKKMERDTADMKKAVDAKMTSMGEYKK